MKKIFLFCFFSVVAVSHGQIKVSPRDTIIYINSSSISERKPDMDLRTDSIISRSNKHYIYSSSFLVDSIVFITDKQKVPRRFGRVLQNKKPDEIRRWGQYLFGANTIMRLAQVNQTVTAFIQPEDMQHFTTDINIGFNSGSKWFGHAFLEEKNLLGLFETTRIKYTGKDKNKFYLASLHVPALFGLPVNAYVRFQSDIREDSLFLLQHFMHLTYLSGAYKLGMGVLVQKTGLESKTLPGIITGYKNNKPTRDITFELSFFQQNRETYNVQYSFFYLQRFPGWSWENELWGIFSKNMMESLVVSTGNKLPHFTLHLTSINAVQYLINKWVKPLTKRSNIYIFHEILHGEGTVQPQKTSFMTGAGFDFTQKNQKISFELRWNYKKGFLIDNQPFISIIKWKIYW